MLPSTLYSMWPMHLQSLRLLHPAGFSRCNYKKIQLLTFDFDFHTRCLAVPSTSCELCTCKINSWYVQQFRSRYIYKNAFFGLWHWQRFRSPPVKYFYWSFQGGTSFLDHLCYSCLVFLMHSCTSVYWCHVVACWESADLLALVCDVKSSQSQLTT